jgi:hypothetical protein
MKLHEMSKQCSGGAVVADRLEALADRIGAIVHPAERLSGPDTWIGPAADDARVAIAASTRDAGEAAVALRRLAARIRSQADG